MYEFQSVENLTEEEYLELNSDIIETPDTDNYLLADNCKDFYGESFIHGDTFKGCESSCHTVSKCKDYGDGYYECTCKFTGKK